jgi:YegS/Rv2252/BmrU family lipid kinase
MEIITEMQARNFAPEVCVIKEGYDLTPAIRSALKRDIDLFVICGGDGTIDQVATTLAGKHATIGIIPTGTRNNVARSLGIPSTIPEAVALLAEGHKVKVDLGVVTHEFRKYSFMEICSVGLFSALYSAADEMQHGNLARIGEFFSTLMGTPPAEMNLVLDKKHKISRKGHGVVISNTSFFGLNYQIAPASAFMDGLLEVLVFTDLSKLDLLTGAIQMAGNEVNDPRIQRFQAKRIEVEMNPPMPIMADGVTLGTGPLHVSVKKETLSIMAGELPSISAALTAAQPEAAA